MSIKTITTDQAPGAIGPYVQGKLSVIFFLHQVKFHWILKQVTS
jgi:hypothetical protein